jgi:peroxiredoxin Q/BCP
MPLIDEGKRAPAFTLPDQNGEKHALRESLGRPVVLYFYPKDDTSGCTKEACAFRDLLPKFDRTNAVVFGVSPDDATSHAKFARKHGLSFTLLADVPTGQRDDPDDKGTPKVCDKYGVWQQKSMHGRTYMGVVRTTYLIDINGKVAKRWDRVKVPGHADEVLRAVEAL